MQIKVEIPDELAAQVKARGLNPEMYVRNLIEDVIRNQVPVADRPKMRMEEFLQAMAANSEKIRVLPDEAYTRAGIYQDHD